ncbi:MAG: hypothetical protein KDA81_18220, partial [Planctomycetaceae bacterium]|nr:hypothetical protein [Planctomycetaceae bacterium]
SCLSLTDWKSVVQLNTTPVLSCHKAVGQNFCFTQNERSESSSAEILCRKGKVVVPQNSLASPGRKSGAHQSLKPENHDNQ